MTINFHWPWIKRIIQWLYKRKDEIMGLFRIPKRLAELEKKAAEPSAPVVRGSGRFFCDSCGNVMRVKKTEPYILDFTDEQDEFTEWSYLQCGNTNCFRHENFLRARTEGVTAK